MSQETISIPTIRKETFQITIEGITPLLTNKFSDKDRETISNKQQKKALGPKEARDPQAEYLSHIHITTDGKPGFPAKGIKAACVSACRFIDDLPMTRARGAFFVLGDILPIEGKHQFREDIGYLKGTIATPIYRPEFLNWKITFTVLHDPNVISRESIVNLIERAGFHIGIGSWRPEKEGNNGMFQVCRES